MTNPRAVRPSEPGDLDNIAAPLDSLLVDAALSPLRRFLPDASTIRFAGRLARRPLSTGRRIGTLAMEYVRIGAGRSAVTPEPRDRRFTDPAWTDNPMLRRITQSYLAASSTLDGLVNDAELEWRDDQRVRFLAENLVEALSPSNIPLLNPTSAKAAIETGGMNFVRGARNLVRDMAAPPRVPTMVDTSAFTVGENLAATPGAVVLRTEMFELIQYAPQTPTVREVPLLLVPPTINKYYAIDLAPGRSWIEHLVHSGQQAFTLSWRNPDRRHADWGLDAYVQAVLDALDTVARICGSGRVLLGGICSGGILASLAAVHLSGTDRLAGLGLAVTVLDQRRAGVPAALADRRLAAAATFLSRRRGYLDGRMLGEVFAWLRPGDLVWNYWVSNYLLGRMPPAFDVLYWNSDTTRMTAQLHADFVDLAIHNRLAEPGSATVLGRAVDLKEIDVDAYVVAGIADHITPWQSCYRTLSLLGGETRFVLSTSGHIAALVNPPDNPKATFRFNAESAGSVGDADEWLRGATTERGTWWPDFSAWAAQRSGSERPAPRKLGGRGYPPIIDAPGTYVFDT
jgi:polyhydroxyalkanoate synthase subunit PhaC